MVFIKWIFALPIIVGVVLFALAHPAPVQLTWNPFEPAITLPLYFVALCFLGIGFFIGAFMAWIGMGKARKDRREQKKKIKQLEKDINTANEKMIDILAKQKPVPSLTNEVIEND